MAVLLTFYSIIIPIENLKKILTKGLVGEIILKKQIPGQVLFDENLFVQWSMSPNDNKEIIKFWESKGLVAIEKRGSKRYWNDLCIVCYPDTSPTLPCDWIEVFRENEESFTIYGSLKGKPKGSLISSPVEIEHFFQKLPFNKKDLGSNLFSNFNMSNFKFIGQVVSNKLYILLIISLFIISLSFYWYEYRPAQARIDCLKEASAVNSDPCSQRMTERCKQYFEVCLLKKGIN